MRNEATGRAEASHAERDGPVVTKWLMEPMSAEVAASVRKLADMPGVRRIAVMPDAHPGSVACNGVAIATTRVVYPFAIGTDIGCGYSAVPLCGDASRLEDRKRRERLLRDVQQVIEILRRRDPGSAPPLEGVIAADVLSEENLRNAAEREGRWQLGTLGRGNHFLEVQSDEEGGAWVMVHSGSRCMGEVISRHYQTERGEPAGFDTESERGSAFLRDHDWAVTYAAASRASMLHRACETIADAIGVEPDWSGMIDAAHNTVTRGKIAGEEMWVHRKSVSPAELERMVIVPGSMAGPTLHVRGCGVEEALYSCAHGAGRRFSRSEARKRFGKHELLREIGEVTIDVRLAAQLVDESPRAYRDVRKVMRAQGELAKVARVLWPRVVLKGV